MELTRAIAQLTQHEASIHLDTVDLVFLLLVVDHCAAIETSTIDDNDLRALYERAYESAEPAGIRGATAAAAAIDRLRNTRVLARMDGGGMARAGSYALTLLGQHIVDFFLSDELLDAESLTALLEQIRIQVVAIQQQAATLTMRAQWHTHVAVPLRTHVAALMTAIDARARTLAHSQETARERILKEIATHWAAEVASYQAVLDEMTTSMKELQDIAMTAAERIHAILGDLETRCRAGGAEASEAVDAVRFAQRHLDALQRWADVQHESTSAFFQLVQSYLRNVVQLDPGRVLETRLREAARVFLDESWTLRVAAEPSLAIIPTVRTVAISEPEQWERCEDTPEEIEAQAVAELEPLVGAALKSGAASVAAVLRQILPTLPADKRYAAIGRVGAILAGCIARDLLEEPQWVPIGDGIAIEDLPLRAPA